VVGGAAVRAGSQRSSTCASTGLPVHCTLVHQGSHATTSIVATHPKAGIEGSWSDIIQIKSAQDAHHQWPTIIHKRGDILTDANLFITHCSYAKAN